MELVISHMRSSDSISFPQCVLNSVVCLAGRSFHEASLLNWEYCSVFNESSDVE